MQLENRIKVQAENSSKIMKIEERLKFLADSNANYSLLWAQWEFDKKLLARALNTVSRDFPHYSLHDVSHSSTIITQIEKFIAPNIDKLSATDCWLLLESCYWHDAGMIISNNEKKALLESNAFRDYLETLVADNHELANYASIILAAKEKNDTTKALQISNALTFVIADYFRVRHADRSGHHVNDPERINIHSPRTTLIPRRLFNFVAQIVQCHGKNRESILDLAKYNDGMDAYDYAHPRYIAALLRIGDLLDIDDGRFCPTLLANIGDVPRSSADHQHKHASVNHLFINSDIIEIKAECEEYGGYHAQQAWFSYIQDEFDYQKRVWNEIVPDNSYRSLPTIGCLDCHIKGFIAIDGRVPKITLDPQRVYNYITGSQIYSEKYPFIRELIQNAIDAIYYQVWDDLSYDETFIALSEEEKRTMFIQALNAKNVEVKAYEKCIDTNTVAYHLSIKDSGTGITLEDIKKILKVGSQNGEYRKTLLRNMPDWAKPSGYFGIGLQSVFNTCDEVTIRTKRVDNPCYVLRVKNSAMFNLAISLKEEVSKRFFGTEVSACLNVNAQEAGAKTLAKLLDYDPLCQLDYSVFKLQTFNIIKENFSRSPVGITLNGERIEYDKGSNSRFPPELSNNIWCSDLELGVDFNLYIDTTGFRQIIFMYKDVEFSMDVSLLGISGKVNIFNEDAGYWLTIDRKKGRADRQEALHNLIDKIKVKYLDILRKNTRDKEEADLYCFTLHDRSERNLWQKYKIRGVEICDYISGKHSLNINHTLRLFGDEHSIRPNAAIFSLLGALKNKLGLSFETSIVGNIENISDSYQRDFHQIKFTDDKAGNVSIEPEIIRQNRIFSGFNRRCAIPCFNEVWKCIAIAHNDIPEGVVLSDIYSDWVNHFIFLRGIHISEEADLEIIYTFYTRNNLTELSRDDFFGKYKACWEAFKA